MDIQPPEAKALQAFADAFTWFVMIAISLLGGVVSFARKVKENNARVWNLTEFLGELATSAFAGIIAFNLCQWRGYPMNLTIALVGICSHMGTKAIMKSEAWLTARFPASPVADDTTPKEK